MTTRFHPEMEIRLTQIFSAAAIAMTPAETRTVRANLKRFSRSARTLGLLALAGEADQLRWQLVAEAVQQKNQRSEATHERL